MRSCIYEGAVSHSRSEPVAHSFRYRLFMVCLDLDEIPALTGPGGLIGASRHRSCSFLPGDHLFGRGESLADEVRELVAARTGRRPRGSIRLLTQLRYFGYYMSPLNLFYVYDEADRGLQCVMAEVNNTPWNERHCYLLWDGNRSGAGELAFQHAKQFHVSPFMDMQMQYRWQLSEPGRELKVSLANFQHSRQLFSAGMTLQRRELSRAMLRRMTLRYPMMTAKISAAIYYQALKLWWKRCPFFQHPKKKPAANCPSAGAGVGRRLPAAMLPQ